LSARLVAVFGVRGGKVTYLDAYRTRAEALEAETGCASRAAGADGSAVTRTSTRHSTTAIQITGCSSSL
jgi:hypothetical protein